MTVSGVTPTGFVPAQTQDILTSIENDEHANIDPGLDMDPDQALGELNGVFADRESSIWQLLQLAFGAFDPSQVEGWLQDALYQLNNKYRKPATNSVTPCLVTLNASTTLAAGALASISGQPSVLFQSVAPVTSTLAGQYPVNFACTVTGPVQCPAGTLTVIAGAQTGWTGVTNTADAVPGLNVETDTAFRVRRANSVQTPGPPPDGLTGALLALSGVQSAIVFENNEDFSDPVSGNPAHSVEILIFDGAIPTVSNDVIAQTIWSNRAGGARLVGNTSGNAVDKNGNTQVVPFSRPVDQDLYFVVNVTTRGTIPSNAATLIADYLAEQANAIFIPGATVVAQGLKSIVYDTRTNLAYNWVFDVPSLLLGTSPSPTNSNNLPMNVRQLPVADSSRIVVNFTPG